MLRGTPGARAMRGWSSIGARRSLRAAPWINTLAYTVLEKSTVRRTQDLLVRESEATSIERPFPRLDAFQVGSSNHTTVMRVTTG